MSAVRALDRLSAHCAGLHSMVASLSARATELWGAARRGEPVEEDLRSLRADLCEVYPKISKVHTGAAAAAQEVTR